MHGIVTTNEFRDWYEALADADNIAVHRVVQQLGRRGTSLGFPLSSKLKGTKNFPLRELRIQSGGRPFRVFYIFDPRRNIVLLIGGDKTGDNRFYDRLILRAESLYADWLYEHESGVYDDMEDE